MYMSLLVSVILKPRVCEAYGNYGGNLRWSTAMIIYKTLADFLKNFVFVRCLIIDGARGSVAQLVSASDCYLDGFPGAFDNREVESSILSGTAFCHCDMIQCFVRVCSWILVHRRKAVIDSSVRTEEHHTLVIYVQSRVTKARYRLDMILQLMPHSCSIFS